MMQTVLSSSAIASPLCCPAWQAVEPQRFADDLEAGDLLVAVAMHDDRLERTGSHRIDAVERIAGAEQRLAALDVARRADHRVDACEFFGRQIGRHATVRNAHDEQQDVARFGWSAGSTRCSGMNGRDGRFVATFAMVCMIGSSWGSVGPPSGGLALTVVPAALVSAAFLWGCPADASGEPETATPVSSMPPLREAFGVFVGMEYGCCATSRKSAGIEVAVGEMEAV
jgi:hypothetical protein